MKLALHVMKKTYILHRLLEHHTPISTALPGDIKQDLPVKVKMNHDCEVNKYINSDLSTLTVLFGFVFHHKRNHSFESVTIAGNI